MAQPSRVPEASPLPSRIGRRLWELRGPGHWVAGTNAGSLCKELRGSSQLAPGASLAGARRRLGARGFRTGGLQTEVQVSRLPTALLVFWTSKPGAGSDAGTETRLLSRAEGSFARWCQAVNGSGIGPGAEALASVLGFPLILRITVEVASAEEAASLRPQPLKARRARSRGDGSEVAARARRGGRPLFLSEGLASSRQYFWRGAPLHTPGPAPPSAGFSSLKAPGSSGRCRFPARPLPPDYPPPGPRRTSPGRSSCGGAAGTTRSERRRRLEISPAGSLCAPTGRKRPREAGTVGAQTRRFRTLPACIEGWDPQVKGRARFTFLAGEGRPWASPFPPASPQFSFLRIEGGKARADLGRIRRKAFILRISRLGADSQRLRPRCSFPAADAGLGERAARARAASFQGF
ncbi:uncharacterized protein LOC133253482 [Bos javanicus]|uniref:uncharacterized protein LOC133253482 n=1 Tax=Bos javanicus TaxID=9906 RepID=UPI002AA7C383|nr:uncharacterized protein LOC133253482 [Bos javanicus]